MTWFIVQTNPNSERKAAAEIRRAGFRAYLPLRAIYRRRRDEREPIKYRPALVGYVFVRFPDQPNWYALRRCQGVRGVLFVDGAPYQLKRGEVGALMLAQRAMRFDDDNATAVRRAWREGQRNAHRILTAERFQLGAEVRDRVTGMLAYVIEVTKRGTVKAVISGKDRDLPVEFRDVDNLELVDGIHEQV